MIYTFQASNGYTFEVVSIKRLITPLASLVGLEAIVYDPGNREIARTQWNQLPMVPRFYEHSTTFYPECRVGDSTYRVANLEACEWLGTVFSATDLADYVSRVS